MLENNVIFRMQIYIFLLFLLVFTHENHCLDIFLMRTAKIYIFDNQQSSIRKYFFSWCLVFFQLFFCQQPKKSLYLWH